MEETRWYLELNEGEEPRPAADPRERVELRKVPGPDPALSLSLYRKVGGDWQWVDRLPWSEEEWRGWLSRPGVETWVAWAGEEPAGYFELAHSPQEGSAEIVYFGLAPGFIGKGLGGWLLVEAVRRAREGGARRVWLHTCTRDHPRALDNYRSRGFRVFRSEPL